MSTVEMMKMVQIILTEEEANSLLVFLRWAELAEGDSHDLFRIEHHEELHRELGVGMGVYDD